MEVAVSVSLPHCLQYGDLPLNYIFILSAILAAYMTSKPLQHSPQYLKRENTFPVQIRAFRLCRWPGLFLSLLFSLPPCSSDLLVSSVGVSAVNWGAVVCSCWELCGFVEEGRAFCMQIWLRAENRGAGGCSRMGSCCLPSQLPKLSWHKATPRQKRLNFPPQSFSFFCIRGCFCRNPPFQQLTQAGGLC